ncbi:hypothetical protein DSBG_1212 [Desulfosporosinus sp. BG]|nr:hypothetical protein DSBG_1212 [Desulfosporosinus sp. BG]
MNNVHLQKDYHENVRIHQDEQIVHCLGKVRVTLFYKI